MIHPEVLRIILAILKVRPKWQGPTFVVHWWYDPSDDCGWGAAHGDGFNCRICDKATTLECLP